MKRVMLRLGAALAAALLLSTAAPATAAEAGPCEIGCGIAYMACIASIPIDFWTYCTAGTEGCFHGCDNPF